MAMVFAMPGNEDLADELAARTAGQTGTIECHRFPDGETYVRIHEDVGDRDTLVVCTLAHPDEQFIALVFAARALRAARAKRITLVAPYLAYLRQDREFHPGEAVSSRIFADLIGREFDNLVTVDPHLHRLKSLDELFSIPAVAGHMTEVIGTWIRDHVAMPIVLGPDAESVQWAEQVARYAGCPSATFSKVRKGDREVQLVAPPSLGQHRERTPVLVDDIISSGVTMIAAAKLLAAAGMRPPHCIAVHALFDETTAAELRGLTQSLMTSDSVPNPYSQFSVGPIIADQLAMLAS